MYDAVVDAKPHLEETAQLLKVTEKQVFVLGYAFKNEMVERNINRNIDKDIQLSIISSEFSKRASSLSQQLFKYVEEDIKTCNRNKYKELMIWLGETKNNWNVTDSFVTSILKHKSLLDIKHSALVAYQYSKALKQIKDRIEVFKKVDEVINNNKDKIINENNLGTYHDQFRHYLDGIHGDAYNEHFEVWLKDHPRVCRTIINESRDDLK